MGKIILPLFSHRSFHVSFNSVVLFSDRALCVSPERKELKEVRNTSVSSDRVRTATLGATDFSEQ